MKVKLNLISVERAKQLNEQLRGKGIPTQGRVLIVSPIHDGTQQTTGGLFVPGNADKDTVPRKGVVVQMGRVDNETMADYPGLDIGSIVTYGLYAGKELDVLDLKDQVATILSLNEVLYIETNN